MISSLKTISRRVRVSALLGALALTIFIPSMAEPGRVAASQPPAMQSPSASTAVARPCHAENKLEIALDCDYIEASATDSNRNSQPRIVLNHAKFWFRVKDDSRMRVELTFINKSNHAISEARPVYVEIDDESGDNHLRRQLPTIDFKKIAPGESVTFSETLRAPAFQTGRYTLYLWIPSPDASMKFDPSHNFLLSNAGVPDEKSGLNALASFTALPRN